MTHPKFIIHNGNCFVLQRSHRYYSLPWPDGGERMLHRRIWAETNGPIPDGYIVHHRDGDWTNNAIENLEIMTASSHARMHLAERQKTPEFILAQEKGLEKSRIAAAKWHGSPEGIAWHKDHGKRMWALRNRVECKCVVCGELFKSMWSDSIYCSKKCTQKAFKYRYHTQSGTCLHCNKQFSFSKFVKRKFCSRGCASRYRA